MGTATQGVKTILWDWNGTLIDDVGICLEVFNDIAAGQGITPITLDAYKAVFSFPVIDCYRQLGFDTSPGAFEQISIQFHSGYEARLSRSPLHRHAESVLQTLNARGMAQYILSAHEQTRLRETVTRYGLQDYFADISGSDNFHGKGKSEHGLELLRHHSIPPESAILVGDTHHDLEVARKLGIRCVLFSGGHISEERLRGSGVPVINCLSQLPALL